MYRSRSPVSSSRSFPTRVRSARTARGASKTRRGRNGDSTASRLKRAAESGPVQKWVKVMRSPAPRIRFLVKKWVPVTELTQEERQEYDREETEKAKRREKEQLQAKQLTSNDGKAEGKPEIPESSGSIISTMAVSPPKPQLISQPSLTSSTLPVGPTSTEESKIDISEEPATKKIRLDESAEGKIFKAPDTTENQVRDSTVTVTETTTTANNTQN